MTRTSDEPVVAETPAERRELTERFGDDIEALFDFLAQQEKQHAPKFVRDDGNNTSNRLITFDFLRNWIRANLTADWYAKRSVAAAYALGEGVRQNGRRARAWYRRAARAGDVSALYDLGMMLLEGEGGAPDLAQGRALVVAAAEAGDPMAQKELAYAFENGLFGFEVDYEQQAKWSSLARQQGMQV